VKKVKSVLWGSELLLKIFGGWYFKVVFAWNNKTPFCVYNTSFVTGVQKRTGV